MAAPFASSLRHFRPSLPIAVTSSSSPPSSFGCSLSLSSPRRRRARAAVPCSVPPPFAAVPRRAAPPPAALRLRTRRMEVLNQLVAGGQFRVVKEPLGFLKLLEWLFSIFAFATCGGFSGSLRLSIECAPPNRSAPITVAFGYPFRLHQVYFEAPSCGGGPPERVFLVGDHSSAAQFFVTVGVGSFLYAPAALGGYLFAPQAYRAGGRGPRIDLGVTAALAFLWLVSSCAWAAALAEVKAATAPSGVLAQVGGCQRPGARCQALGAPRTSGLNTSVVFGFLNLVLWTGNLWFVFKETGWGGLGARAPPPRGGSPKRPRPQKGGTAPPRGGTGSPGGGTSPTTARGATGDPPRTGGTAREPPPPSPTRCRVLPSGRGRCAEEPPLTAAIGGGAWG
uniref:Synaptophysin n=1 Tax=Taeniopygia guttata TaxID=59729 RepID=A0A674HJ56_TAEGU|nr:synaptophysin-like [Taeniopygia guttata]